MDAAADRGGAGVDMRMESGILDFQTQSHTTSCLLLVPTTLFLQIDLDLLNEKW